MFLASRILLLLFVIAGALLAAEATWFGAVYLGNDALSHQASPISYLPFAGGVVVLALCLVGLKYVFRPPARRARYWTVFAALPTLACLSLYLLAR